MSKSLLKGLICIGIFLASCSGGSQLPNEGAYLTEGGNYIGMALYRGGPNRSDIEGMPITEQVQPLITLWYSEIEPSSLVLLSENELVVEYDWVPIDDTIYEITPIEALNPGRYCIVQGNAALSPADLPYWCFQINNSNAEIQKPENPYEGAISEIVDSANVFELTGTPEIAWKRDGSTMAAAITIRDTPNANLIQEFTAPLGSPPTNIETEFGFRFINYLPDGTLRPWDTAGGIVFWDLETNTQIAQFLSPRIVWSHDASQVAIAKGNIVNFYNSKSMEKVATVEADIQVLSMSISRGGKWLAVGGNGSINILDINTGDLMNAFEIEGRVGTLQWNFDDSRLASISAQSGVTVWEKGTGAIAYNQKGFKSYWSPNSSELLILEDRQGELHLWNELSGDVETISIDDGIESAVWNPNGRWLAIVAGKENGPAFEGALYIWDTVSADKIGPIVDQSHINIIEVVWDPSGEGIVVSGHDPQGEKYNRVLWFLSVESLLN